MTWIALLMGGLLPFRMRVKPSYDAQRRLLLHSCFIHMCLMYQLSP